MSCVNHGNRFGSFLGTFVVGAAAGATIAVLTAPRSGRETRARLKEAAGKMGKTMRRIPSVVQESGTKAAQERPGSKDYTGLALDKELPRFAR